MIKSNYPTVEALWNDFLLNHPNDSSIPISFYFCDNKKDANECADLVVQQIKKATATSLWWFNENKKPIPKIGDQYIITDWEGIAQTVVEVTKVEQVAFNQITSEFARTEGEGDKSLAYWRKVHKAYYSREMKRSPEDFDENMIIVCEYFKTIYPALQPDDNK